MHVVAIGTFLLPRRFTLADLIQGGREQVVVALRTAFAEFTTPAETGPTEVMLDYHRSISARQLETLLFSGEIAVEQLGRVALHISALSVGFVVVELDLPDGTTIDLDSTDSRDAFKAVESPVTNALAPLIRQWSQRAVDAAPEGLTDRRPSAALAPGQLLWWHRVLVEPADTRCCPAAHWYGVRADLADGATVSVGNGFTCLSGGRRFAGDVVEGLMTATQEWLIVDEAKRLLADQLVKLGNGRNSGQLSIDDQYAEVLCLTEEITLRGLVLNEEARYLANARGRVRHAATESWRIAEEMADLEQRTSALRELFTLHRERIFNNRDDRRNSLIFAFTGLTLIQLILDWYDFLTDDKTALGHQPRPLIAYSVLALVMVILGVGLLVRRRSRLPWRGTSSRRRTRPSRPPGR